MPRQDADGTPHMTYYDFDHAMSFAWDGLSNTVQVMQGGYGEPVVDTFEVNEMPCALRFDYNFQAAQFLSWFRIACEQYLEMQDENKQPTESWN